MFHGDLIHPLIVYAGMKPSPFFCTKKKLLMHERWKDDYVPAGGLHGHSPLWLVVVIHS